MVVSENKWKNEHGIDTFYDVVHMDTLKILLAMAASANWKICKVDVAEAFLIDFQLWLSPGKKSLNPFV